MQLRSETSTVVTFLIANKIDLGERKVSKEEGELYAKKHSMLYAETSAKTNIGVIDVFKELGAKIMDAKILQLLILLMTSLEVQRVKH